MRRDLNLLRLSFFFFLILLPFKLQAEKTALLLVAHGSPRKEWNSQIVNLQREVSKRLLKDSTFTEVGYAFMEFSKPSVSEKIQDLEGKGIERIIIMPIFIAPSTHTCYDLPCILGIFGAPKITKKLEKEGISLLRNTKVRFLIGPTLDKSDILQDIMLKRASTLSSQPEDEALIILAHGDEDFEPIWERLVREIGSYILGKTGITYFDYAFTKMGKNFLTEALPIIARARERRKKVIVLGLYVATGAEKIADMSFRITGGDKVRLKKSIFMDGVVYSKMGILPSHKLAKWISETSLLMVRAQ